MSCFIGSVNVSTKCIGLTSALSLICVFVIMHTVHGVFEKTTSVCELYHSQNVLVYIIVHQYWNHYVDSSFIVLTVLTGLHVYFVQYDTLIDGFPYCSSFSCICCHS